MLSSDHVRLGVLTRPHGVKGELRCALEGVAIPTVRTPCDVLVGYSPSFTSRRRLVDFRSGREGELICRFEKVEDRDAAAELVDHALFVPKSVLTYEDPFADPGLIGYSVVDPDGNVLGEIVAIYRTSAHYLWEVAAEDHDWMLPAIEEFVESIDEEEGRVIVRLIPGLFDESEVEEASRDGRGRTEEDRTEE